MTIVEAKKEVANENGYDSWMELIAEHSIQQYGKFFNEVERKLKEEKENRNEHQHKNNG